MDRLIEMKVKIKSLAEEARIIRHEEKKTTGFRYLRLRQHRIWDVRRESRATQIAYACMRGVPYDAVEPNSRKDWNWKEVVSRAKKIALNFKPVMDWDNENYNSHKEAVEDHKKKVEEWFNELWKLQDMQTVRIKVVKDSA